MAKSIAPEGWHAVTPRIFTEDAPGLVVFLQHVFGATGEWRPESPAEMHIGDSVIMVSDTAVRAATPACLYVYLSDLDGTYERAITSGATSLEAPRDTPYGDRRAMVEDRWGNTWQLAVRG